MAATPGPFRAPLMLLNCSHCDDVIRLIETERSCGCGLSRGWSTGDVTRTSPSARIIVISWEAYDGIAEGESRLFTVLPRVQTKGRLT